MTAITDNQRDARDFVWGHTLPNGLTVTFRVGHVRDLPRKDHPPLPRAAK